MDLFERRGPRGAWPRTSACKRAGWRTGVGTARLAAAVDRATAHGARTVEGYPVTAPSVDAYTGYDTMFARAGFHLIRPGRGRGRAPWRKSV